MIRPWRFAFLALAALIIPQPAFAWDGVKTGRVTQLDVTGGNNFGVRIIIEGVDEMCGPGSANFAYLNDTASNYQIYVSALLAARSTGARVTIYTTATMTPFGKFCEIGYFVW